MSHELKGNIDDICPRCNHPWSEHRGDVHAQGYVCPKTDELSSTESILHGELDAMTKRLQQAEAELAELNALPKEWEGSGYNPQQMARLVKLYNEQQAELTRMRNAYETAYKAATKALAERDDTLAELATLRQQMEAIELCVLKGTLPGDDGPWSAVLHDVVKLRESQRQEREAAKEAQKALLDALERWERTFRDSGYKWCAEMIKSLLGQFGRLQG